jgi:hypothetical protein
MANINQSMIISAAGLAIAIGLAWGVASNASMHPNKEFENLRKPNWKYRISLAGTEAAQRRLLRDAKFYKEFDLVPMEDRIDMWNVVLTSAYKRGDIAKQTYSAWKDKLPV